MLKLNLPFVIYTDRTTPDALVARITADGAAEGEFAVVENADGRFVISNYDEDGLFVGNL